MADQSLKFIFELVESGKLPGGKDGSTTSNQSPGDPLPPPTTTSEESGGGLSSIVRKVRGGGEGEGTARTTSIGIDDETRRMRQVVSSLQAQSIETKQVLAKVTSTVESSLSNFAAKLNELSVKLHNLAPTLRPRDERGRFTKVDKAKSTPKMEAIRQAGFDAPGLRRAGEIVALDPTERSAIGFHNIPGTTAYDPTELGPWTAISGLGEVRASGQPGGGRWGRRGPRRINPYASSAASRRRRRARRTRERREYGQRLRYNAPGGPGAPFFEPGGAPGPIYGPGGPITPPPAPPAGPPPPPPPPPIPPDDELDAILLATDPDRYIRQRIMQGGMDPGYRRGLLGMRSTDEWLRRRFQSISTRSGRRRQQKRARFKQEQWDAAYRRGEVGGVLPLSMTAQSRFAAYRAISANTQPWARPLVYGAWHRASFGSGPARPKGPNPVPTLTVIEEMRRLRGLARRAAPRAILPMMTGALLGWRAGQTGGGKVAGGAAGIIGPAIGSLVGGPIGAFAGALLGPLGAGAMDDVIQTTLKSGMYSGSYQGALAMREASLIHTRLGIAHDMGGQMAHYTRAEGRLERASERLKAEVFSLAEPVISATLETIASGVETIIKILRWKWDDDPGDGMPLPPFLPNEKIEGSKPPPIPMVPFFPVGGLV